MKPLRLLAVSLLLVAAGLALALAWLTQPGVTPLAPSQPAADPERLRRHVEHLAGPLAARDHAHPATLNRAADYIERHFREAGAQVSRQTYFVEGIDYANIIARFGPATGAPLVIGAHYDAHAGTPGADDNASGVAGLLETARWLGQRAPRLPVELVAYTLEEPPYFRTEHMGSRQHAAALARAGRLPRLVVALETIGYFDDRPGSQHYPFAALAAVYPDRGDFVAVVGRAGDVSAVRTVKAALAGGSRLPVVSINAPAALQGIDFSDHASYWPYGVPAVMVTDTAFYRNPNYHEATDRPPTLDYPRMARVVDGVQALIAAYETRETK